MFLLTHLAEMAISLHLFSLVVKASTPKRNHSQHLCEQI